MTRHLLRHAVLILMMAVNLAAMAQGWALPKVSVAILRSEPRHSAEQVSQVVMGTPLKVLLKKGDWWKVETPEGYTGFVRNNTLSGYSDSQIKGWRNSPRIVMMTDRTEYIISDTIPGAMRVSDVVNGTILTSATPSSGRYVAVTLPDGRNGFIERALTLPIEDWATQKWDPAMMPAYAANFIGAPYVWGGTSLKGMDCSGLTQISAYRQGRILPRDASQQVNVGVAVDKSDFNRFQPGDLLFFGNTATGRINHVAISMGGPKYIHSSARVRISSLDPLAPDFENPGLIAVRRITQAEAAERAAILHPWYF